MLRIMYARPDGAVEFKRTDGCAAGEEAVSPSEALEWLRGRIPVPSQGLLWVDAMGEPPPVVEPLLKETFGFHPLAVVDALKDRNLPKVDDWGSYLYFLAQTFQSTPHDMAEVDMDRIGRLDVFKGRHFLVTLHPSHIPAIDREWTACSRDHRRVWAGAGRLLYHVLDDVATDYALALDKIEDRIDRLEDRLFGRPDRGATLEEIFVLKRTLVSLRRVLLPQREAVNKLARDDFAAIDPKNRVYFRDVHDHFIRLYEMNEALRDLLSSCLDMYLSLASQRTNERMKVLAVVTTLFCPLSFLTGFWGMNFFEPSPNTPWCRPEALYATLAAMAVGPPLALAWLRWRKWI